MDTHTLSALVAALLVAAIGLSAYLEEKRRPPHWYFILFCLNLLVFHLADFLRLLLAARPADLVSNAAAAVVPISAIKFFKVFLSSHPVGPQKVDRPVLVISGLFVLALGYFAIFPSKRAEPMVAAAIFAFVILSLSLCLFYIYRRYLESVSAVERTRLVYLMASGAFAVLAALVAYLPDLRGVPSAVAKLIPIIYLYFIAQMLFYHRLMDLQDVLARLAILASLLLILTGVYAALVAWVDPENPGMFFYNTLIASFVVIILVDPLKSAVEDRVHRTLFRERYELRSQLDKLRWRLSQILELTPLFEEAISALEQTRRVTHVTIYRATVDQAAFRLVAHLGPKPPERLEAAANRIFLDRLRTDGVLVHENLQRARQAQTMGWEEPGPEDQALDEVLRALQSLNANVCFPLVAENRMLGIFSVNDDRMREAFSPEEVEQFKLLANQLAVGIQNSRVFERMKERDRLAALGEMAAGLAHEIRNPLGAMKGAAQYLQEEVLSEPASSGNPASHAAGSAITDIRGVPEDTREFFKIIVEEVNRLNTVVTQFLDYARPDRVERTPLQINDVVRKTIQVLTSQAENTKVELDVQDDLPEVPGDAEQLHQVFLNLGMNAVQSMSGEGQLTVSTFLRPSPWEDKTGDMVIVSFKDNGPGITAEQLRRIFIPFVTTKKGGSGLGLPISQRIVENHGGRIEVDSRPGEGATFRVVLPAGDSAVITKTMPPIP